MTSRSEYWANYQMGVANKEAPLMEAHAKTQAAARKIRQERAKKEGRKDWWRA